MKNKNTIVLRCDCSNPYQDLRYGKQLRIHNICETAGKINGYRCTGCGTKR